MNASIEPIEASSEIDFKNFIPHQSQATCISYATYSHVPIFDSIQSHTFGFDSERCHVEICIYFNSIPPSPHAEIPSTRLIDSIENFCAIICQQVRDADCGGRALWCWLEETGNIPKPNRIPVPTFLQPCVASIPSYSAFVAQRGNHHTQIRKCLNKYAVSPFSARVGRSLHGSFRLYRVCVAVVGWLSTSFSMRLFACGWLATLPLPVPIAPAPCQSLQYRESRSVYTYGAAF